MLGNHPRYNALLSIDLLARITIAIKVACYSDITYLRKISA